MFGLMTVDQIILITTVLILLVFFIKTNYRIDALSISALIFLVAVSALTDDINIISPDEAFLGFANPAVMTVILVLVISSGLEKAGLSGMAGKILLILLLVAATLSSFINNIGAMAILLPLTLSVCNKMSWNAGKFLMPLAFACILGGMNTLIGTPPNIIISDYAYQQTGSEFNFFDFSKVGLIVTISGILFIVFIGKRLIPMRDVSDGAPLIDLKGFLFEVKVNKGSSSTGLTLYQFNKQAGDDIEIMGIVSDTGSLKKVKNNIIANRGSVQYIDGLPDNLAFGKHYFYLSI